MLSMPSKSTPLLPCTSLCPLSLIPAEKRYRNGLFPLPDPFIISRINLRRDAKRLARVMQNDGTLRSPRKRRSIKHWLCPGAVNPPSVMNQIHSPRKPTQLSLSQLSLHHAPLLLGGEHLCALLQSVYQDVDGIILEVVCCSHLVQVFCKLLCGTLEVVGCELG